MRLMKKFLSSLVLSFAMLLPPTFYVIAPTALVLVTTQSGCKTANQAAYKGVGTVIVTVETAMKAWGDYVESNHPSLEQRTAVKTAFEKYQAAMLVVTSAGAAHAKVLADQAADPGTKATALSVLNAAIAASSQTLADLIDLVRKFGVKI